MPVPTETGRVTHDAFPAAWRPSSIGPAIAGALATAGPIAIGIAVGDPFPYLVAGLGGLNVALAIPPSTTPAGAVLWGGISLVGCALAMLLGTLCGLQPVLAGLGSLIWIACWLSLRAIGPHGAAVGFVTSVLFVIGAGLPAAASDAIPRALQVAAGGTLAIAFGVVACLVGGRRSGRADSSEWPGIGPALRGVRRGLAQDALLRAYVLRTSITIAAVTLAYHALGQIRDHGYWVAVTILVVMQPDRHSGRVRSLQRGVGTLVGGLVVILVVLLTNSDWVLPALIGMATFGVFAIKESNYFVAVTLITPTALLMLSTVDFEHWSLTMQRVAATLIGIVIATIVCELLWRQPPMLATPPEPAEATG
jgi:hypothetical protein